MRNRRSGLVRNADFSVFNLVEVRSCLKSKRPMQSSFLIFCGGAVDSHDFFFGGRIFFNLNRNKLFFH